MKTLLGKLLWKQTHKKTESKLLTLEDFFPEDTVYFYGYPSGIESGFLNLVSPSVEEIVAARANICTGNSIKVVNFHATSEESIGSKILEKLGLEHLKNKQIIVMPKNIDNSLVGAKRNSEVKKFLNKNIPKGKLVMAQPFTDKSFEDLCLIKPSVTAWLNDKKNMPLYITKSLLPIRYGSFESGKELTEKSHRFNSPAVIKISSSSAGDGVYICNTEADLENTIKKLRNFNGSIVVDELVKIKKNYGIQFGVNYKNNKFEILGVTEQIATNQGEFLGGVIRKGEFPKEVIPAINELKQNILPFAKKLGWFGIGCFDVLIDNKNHCYFIDANFRMTGMSACIFYHRNTNHQTNFLSFGGTFEGNSSSFDSNVLDSCVKNNDLEILALSRNKKIWRFNGVISFSNKGDLMKKISRIKNTGIESEIFNMTESMNL